MVHGIISMIERVVNETVRWVMNLNKRLSNDIVDVYNYYGGIYKNRANDLILEDEDAAKLQSDKHTKCLEIQIKLKDSVYKDKVMKECKEKFYDKDLLISLMIRKI